MRLHLYSSNRFRLKIKAGNRVFCFTKHALQRLTERGLTAEQVVARVSDKPLAEHRRHGVVTVPCKAGLKVVTAW